MRYAIVNKKTYSEVKFSGQLGTCKTCGSEVIGKKGEFNKAHWAHLSKRDCDDQMTLLLNGIYYDSITFEKNKK